MSNVQDPDWESFLRGLARRWDGYGGGEKLGRAVAELDHLRAELAETRAAGDELAVEVEASSDPFAVQRAVEKYRRSVRGDAPARGRAEG